MQKKKIIIIIIFVLTVIACIIFAAIKLNKDTEHTLKNTELIPVEDVHVLLEEGEFYYTPETIPEKYLKKDFDGDKLSNKDEIENGTDMYRVDTDNDGISDSQELKETKTDPAKYSTKEDGVSDLEWWFSQNDNFKEGWSKLDPSGYRVYLKKATDRTYTIKKVSADEFDDLETITEAYQIKGFSGRMALDTSTFNEEVYNHIVIYILNGDVIKKTSVIIENGLITFEISENDVFVAVYN